MPTPLEQAIQRLAESLPGWFGFEIETLEPGLLRARMAVTPQMLAPNGYLHAASVVLLADTACGYGCLASLPESAESFTTLELKTNFTGTARSGVLSCEARLHHAGRNTQVWDAAVRAEDPTKAIALFRCTQMILYPRLTRPG